VGSEQASQAEAGVSNSRKLVKKVSSKYRFLTIPHQGGTLRASKRATGGRAIEERKSTPQKAGEKKKCS